MGEAFQQAGLPWAPDTHEDRGDGILIPLPPEVPKSLLVELLPSALVAALTAHNHAHPDEERIRLRMSLHAGEVFYDQHGLTGEAVNWAFRLIDARLLKVALASSTGVLAVIASSWFFDQVIRHAAADVRPTYRRVVVRAKDASGRGWICLPDATKPAVAGTSPYKGLRAFEKEDQGLFFGRENAVRRTHGRGCRIRAGAGGRKVGGREILARAGRPASAPGEIRLGCGDHLAQAGPAHGPRGGPGPAVGRAAHRAAVRAGSLAGLTCRSTAWTAAAERPARTEGGSVP